MPGENTLIEARRDTLEQQSTLDAQSNNGGSTIEAKPFVDELASSNTEDIQTQPNEDSRGDLKIVQDVEQSEEDENGNKIVKEPEDDLGAFDKLLGKANEKLQKVHLSEADKNKLAEEAKKTEGGDKTTTELKDGKAIDKATPEYKSGVLKEYGLDEAAATTLAKKMSTPAFEFAVSKLKEAKELREEVAKRDKKLSEITTGKLPDNYLEHPDAYVLDPRFGQAQQAVRYQGQIKDFYTEQYAKCRAGEDWEDLRTAADGKSLVTVKMQANPRAEAYIAERLNRADNAMNQFQGQAQAIVQQHKQQYAGLTNKIREQEDKYFPTFKDPQAMAKNPHIMAALKGFNDMGLLNNPVTGFTAKMYAFAMELKAENDVLKKQVGTKTNIAKQQQKAGPTSSVIQSGARVEKGNGSAEDVEGALGEFARLTGKVVSVRR